MNDLLLMSQWLKNPNRKYSEGLSLYMKYESTPKYDDFLKKGLTNPDTVTSNMLFYRLSKMLRILSLNPSLLEKKIIEHSANIKPIGVVKTPGVNQNNYHKPINTNINPDKLPDHILKKYYHTQKIKPLIENYYHKLKSSDNIHSQKQLAKKLLCLDLVAQKLWEQINLSLNT